MTISDMIKEMRERAEDKRCMARANAQAFNTPLDETAGRFEDEAASTIEALAEALEPFANAGGKLDLMRDDVVTSIRFGLMLDVTTTVADFSRARSALNLLKGEGVTVLTPSPLEGGSAAAASRSRKGERTCGECHLKEGEICDICGARRPVDASVNADLIAMILAEDCSIEDGRISNVPYVAVKIAEAIERSRLQPAAAVEAIVREVLIKALTPFAHAADNWVGMGDTRTIDEDGSITVAHLRGALAALLYVKDLDPRSRLPEAGEATVREVVAVPREALDKLRKAFEATAGPGGAPEYIDCATAFWELVTKISPPAGEAPISAEAVDPDYESRASSADNCFLQGEAPSPSLEGQEPVAWRFKYRDTLGWIYSQKHPGHDCHDIEPLFASPHVPEGDELNELCRKKDEEIARLRTERSEIIEMCAKVADNYAAEIRGHTEEEAAASYLAGAIRSLKSPSHQTGEDR